MKPCLVDVNALLALSHERHQHHLEALQFAAQLGEGYLRVCRLAQLGLLRLLCNPHAMQGRQLTGQEAWQVLDILMRSRRVAFVPEPPDLSLELARFANFPGVGPNFWTDAYLAAFAAGSGLPLATFDQGFRKFNVPVYVLGARRN